MAAAPETDPVRSALAQGWRMLAADPAAAARQAEALLAGATAPNDAALLLACARRRQSRIGEAHDTLRPLIERHPVAAIPWFEWGMVLAAMGQDARAIEAFRRAVRIEPGFTGAWRAMADVLLISGAGVAAGEAYAQAARAAAPAPHLAQAGAALCANRPAEAEAMLRRIVQSAPGDLRAMHLLGEAATRVNRLVEAQAVLEECLALSAGFADARHSLAVLFYVQRKFADALPHFLALLALAPFHASLRVLVAVCLAELGDFAAAIPHLAYLLAAWPAQPQILLKYAHALKTVGQEPAAAAAYRDCIALAPDWCSGAYLSLADIKTVPITDAECAAMRSLLGRARPQDAARLHYALGAAAEQRRDYAGAFAHFAEGGRLRRAEIRTDPASVTAFVAASRAVFTPDLLTGWRGGGCASEAPIFIVGMPRSGSTLVEQILASHPAVEATSELKVLGDIAADLRGGAALAALPGIVAGLDPAARQRLGERYLAEAAPFRLLGRPHFLDKMPDNVLHTGLIHAILPNARVIDVRRAPMAAGFAAFKQYFQVTQPGADYSYDLAEIGRYTRDYVALTAHFGSVLPGRIHLLRYEALVGDLEGEVRRLLAACGLDFEPACLRFWETARPVQTPSAQQVRQPIFTRGLAQWRHYDAWLGPLREALGPLADGVENPGAP